MPYIDVLLVQIVAALGRLTTAILGIQGGGGGGGTSNPYARVKEFYDQNGIVSGQSYTHNFQATGLAAGTFRVRVRGWDTDNYEVMGIRAVAVDGNNAQVFFDDSGTPFSGDLEFYVTQNPV